MNAQATNSRCTVLLTGAGGQIGIELTARLRQKFGTDQVVATDILQPKGSAEKGPFEVLDVTNRDAVMEMLHKYQPSEVYHLASLLSATSEKKPEKAWEVNVGGLLNILEACRSLDQVKLFWPSSIAVFGPSTPKDNTPQDTVIDPYTVYGIGKLTGERWCQWYHNNYGLDVRSLRYPGLISYKVKPGGGTTDYAVDIFFKAVEEGKYTSYLKADTALPMMFMEDAIRGTLELMEADSSSIKIRSSYNFAAMSFTPASLAASIAEFIPGFKIDYKPDFRQAIADSWPASIDDQEAQKDWGWKPEYRTQETVSTMLDAIRQQVAAG